MIEQYVNTFLETPRPNVIQTASHCCFEKFRIKRYPNRGVWKNRKPESGIGTGMGTGTGTGTGNSNGTETAM